MFDFIEYFGQLALLLVGFVVVVDVRRESLVGHFGRETLANVRMLDLNQLEEKVFQQSTMTDQAFLMPTFGMEIERMAPMKLLLSE